MFILGLTAIIVGAGVVYCTFMFIVELIGWIFDFIGDIFDF